MGLASTLVPPGSDFTLQNLPWGVARLPGGAQHICVALGEHALDVHVWASSLDQAQWSPDIVSALQQVRSSPTPPPREAGTEQKALLRVHQSRVECAASWAA